MSPCALPTSCNRWPPVLVGHATLLGQGLDGIPFSSEWFPWCPLGAIQDAGRFVGGCLTAVKGCGLLRGPQGAGRWALVGDHNLGGQSGPGPDTRSGRLLPPWVLARAHLMPVRGLGDERRPRSRRGGQGPRANFCASRASSSWVGGWMTTLVETRRPVTEGELLRLGNLHWLGWGMDDDRGQGAASRDQGRTPAAQRPAARGLGDG